MNRKHLQPTGFTITELLIGIAVVGLLTAIAIPSLNEFIIKSRVDSEISELQRLILTARNNAVNSGKNVTLCPLSSSKCSTNWINELSIFDNNANTLANSIVYDDTNEQLIKSKNKLTTGDTLKFSSTNAIIFSPTGRAISGANSRFSYCPKGYPSLSRGIEVSLSGRVYITSDTDNDGKDENRNGSEVSCS